MQFTVRGEVNNFFMISFSFWNANILIQFLIDWEKDFFRSSGNYKYIMLCQISRNTFKSRLSIFMNSYTQIGKLFIFLHRGFNFFIFFCKLRKSFQTQVHPQSCQILKLFAIFILAILLWKLINRKIRDFYLLQFSKFR